MRTVAALYVDPRGPYFGMPGVDPWDKARDAELYAGPHPVVAHPACGPWGRLKGHCKHQDPRHGLLAVEQVRRWGGVLEHPADSSLWKAAELPLPGWLPDAWGGFSVALRQCDWGHRAAKPTWLYLVGIDPADVDLRRPAIAPTHKVTNNDRPGMAHLQRLPGLEARLSPPAFAEWLVSLARSARPLWLSQEAG